ncbi:MAG: DinB family protein [Dehalococcoidia bacterium]|nr:DinB family protein [Dehalococcoidia bacterium]
MITSIDAFLRYFDAVHRRAVRDIAALPPEADGWRPAVGTGENAWSINQVIGHMAGSRLYFASAYAGNGWVSPRPPDVRSRAQWVPAIEASARALREALEGTPDAWLARKVAMIDSAGELSGWRVLMMMVEHDIHHRSQVDTYAGANGWDVPQIFDRSAETIERLQPGQRAKHGRDGQRAGGSQGG